MYNLIGNLFGTNKSFERSWIVCGQLWLQTLYYYNILWRRWWIWYNNDKRLGIILKFLSLEIVYNTVGLYLSTFYLTYTVLFKCVCVCVCVEFLFSCVLKKYRYYLAANFFFLLSVSVSFLCFACNECVWMRACLNEYAVWLESVKDFIIK